MCDHSGRHVAHMLDAEYRVHRLAPDGTCRPVRNLAAIHHEVDDSMHGPERPTRHGLARGTALFDEVLEREREIALEHLRAMGVAPGTDDGPAAAVSHEPADAEEQLRQLRERIAREINRAELAMLELYPEMDGHPEEGEGDDGAEEAGSGDEDGG